MTGDDERCPMSAWGLPSAVVRPIVRASNTEAPPLDDPPRAPIRSALTIQPLLQHSQRICDVPGLPLPLEELHVVHCTANG
jgi:hypothetical protein